MASLLLLLAGLHAHDLRNHPPARDAGYNIRTSLIQPALNTQQEPVQAAADTLYLHVQRLWTTLATHTMRHGRTYTWTHAAGAATDHHKHHQPEAVRLSVRIAPDHAHPQPASTAALHTLPLSQHEPTTHAPHHADGTPPHAPHHDTLKHQGGRGALRGHLPAKATRSGCLTPFPPREIGLLAENGISLPFARGALP